MSITRTKKVIKRFIQAYENKQPEIIAITGSWGSGKTHIWNETVKEFLKETEQAINYSYTSLFGVKESNDLQVKIHDNNVESVKKNTKAKRNSYSKIISLPNISHVLDTMKENKQISFAPKLYQKIAEARIDRYLICLDDIERAHQDIDLHEVLSIASQLKENKNCSIVFILNKDEIKNSNLDFFNRLHEKVFDYIIEHELDYIEAVDISTQTSMASGTTTVKEKMINDANLFGLTNIRILRKIKHYLEEIENLFKHETDHNKFDTIARWIFIYFFTKHTSKEEIPDYGFIKTANSSYEYHEDSIEAIKHDFLHKVNFPYGSTLAMHVFSMLDNGYIDHEILQSSKLLSEEYTASSKAREEIKEIIREYKNSLTLTLENITQRAIQLINEYGQYINLHDLSEVLATLRDTGANHKATELINLFVEKNKNEIERFIAGSPYNHSYRIDEELLHSICSLFKESCTSIHLNAILETLEDRNKASKTLSAYLASIEKRVYIDFFESYQGSRLEYYIEILLSRDETKKLSSSTDVESINNRAKEALAHMAKNNPLNEIRLKKYLHGE